MIEHTTPRVKLLPDASSASAPSHTGASLAGRNPNTLVRENSSATLAMEQGVCAYAGALGFNNYYVLDLGADYAVAFVRVSWPDACHTLQ